ncbi:OLC1v1023871C2 [Oldenlandia corymbosa var. corymbosa]|uniref:OLC1v1023871C2 n=1 Tax=Oldenlandia corymbosa var. corymbosa TaxID=529605 RepID=A0AAV1C2E2_OLDCO|nr:OLC1v1023871C2 [Oldenlandia corymbosa var. corymbosa]
MVIVAGVAAARSICRSTPLRQAAASLASKSKSSASPFRLPSSTRSSHRIFSRIECNVGVNAAIPYCNGIKLNDFQSHRLALRLRLALRRHVSGLASSEHRELFFAD